MLYVYTFIYCSVFLSFILVNMVLHYAHDHFELYTHKKLTIKHNNYSFYPSNIIFEYWTVFFSSTIYIYVSSVSCRRLWHTLQMRTGIRILSWNMVESRWQHFPQNSCPQLRQTFFRSYRLKLYVHRLLSINYYGKYLFYRTWHPLQRSLVPCFVQLSDSTLPGWSATLQEKILPLASPVTDHEWL